MIFKNMKQQLYNYWCIIGMLLAFPIHTFAEPVTVTLDFSGGTMLGTESSGLYSGWKSPLYDDGTQYTLTTPARNMKRGTDGRIQLAAGRNLSSTYTLEINKGFSINKLVLSGKSVGADLYIEYVDPMDDIPKVKRFPANVQTTLEIDGNNKQVIIFTLVGNNNSDGSINLSASPQSEHERGCHITWYLKPTYQETAMGPYEMTYRKGSPLKVPPLWRRGYCNYTFHESSYTGEVLTTVPQDNTATIYITYDMRDDAPVTFSPDIDHAVWHKFTVNTNGTTPTFRTLTSNGTGAPQLLSTDEPTNNLSDTQLWAFVGDAYNCKIVNKTQTDRYLAASSNNSSGNLTLGTDPYTDRSDWALYENASWSGTAEGMAWRLNANDVYLNLTGTTLTSTYFANGQQGARAYLYNPSASGTNLAKTTLFNATECIPVVYKVYNGTETLVEQSPTVYEPLGTSVSLPYSQRRAFCQYSYDHDVIEEQTTEVQVSYGVSGAPFEFSPDMNNLHYYWLRVNNTNAWEAVHNTVSGTDIGKAKVLSSNTEKDTKTLWAFVGDPYGLMIVNRQAGNSRPLSVSTADYTTLLNTTEGSLSSIFPKTQAGDKLLFDLFVYNTSADNLFFRLKRGDTDFSSTNAYLQLINGFVGFRRTSSTFEANNFTANGGVKLGIEQLRFMVQPVYTSTFQVTRQNGTVNTYNNVNFITGDAPYLPSNYRHPFKRYEYYTDATFTSLLPVMNESTTTVYVKEMENLPFEVSNPENNTWKWYYMSIRDNKYITALGPGPYRAKNNKVDFSPMALWAFVKTANGFEIYNRWYGSEYVLTNPYNGLFAGTTNHQVYKAPVMMKKTEAEQKTIFTHVEIRSIQYHYSGFHRCKS